MIALLEDYIAFLKNAKVEADQHHSEKYHIPSEVALPEEWAEFDHAYQLHCPSLFLDKSTRDVRSSAFWRYLLTEFHRRLWSSIIIRRGKEKALNITWHPGK